MLVIVIGASAYLLVPARSQASGKAPVGASLTVYEDFPNGTQKAIHSSSAIPFFSVLCNSCGSGGSAVSFQPSNSVSWSGDTTTGGKCSGTVSFNSVDGITVSSQSVSASFGGSSTTSGTTSDILSSQATVSFSTFSSATSGSYTLTATYASSCSITFTNGGANSGVPVPASTSPTQSVTITISNGQITGVSAGV